MRLACAITIAAVVPCLTLAHGSEEHGFQLVSFAKPFPAPPFQVRTLDNGTVTLSKFRGQYLLLNFWATWCAPCMREMPSIEKLNQHFKGKGLTVLAIAEDAEGTGLVAPYTKKLGLTFEFGLDPRQAVGVQYGARDLPTTFLIDQAGRVIAAAKGARDWASPGALDYLGELLAQVPAR